MLYLAWGSIFSFSVSRFNAYLSIILVDFQEISEFLPFPNFNSFLAFLLRVLKCLNFS